MDRSACVAGAVAVAVPLPGIPYQGTVVTTIPEAIVVQKIVTALSELQPKRSAAVRKMESM